MDQGDKEVNPNIKAVLDHAERAVAKQHETTRRFTEIFLQPTEPEKYA